MNPACLHVGDRITCTVGTLVVDSEPFVDIGEETARRFGVEYQPEDDRVWVDCTAEDPAQFGDPNDLPAATGAKDFQWLGSTPKLRYRLFFHPDADVKVAT